MYAGHIGTTQAAKICECTSPTFTQRMKARGVKPITANLAYGANAWPASAVMDLQAEIAAAAEAGYTRLITPAGLEKMRRNGANRAKQVKKVWAAAAAGGKGKTASDAGSIKELLDVFRMLVGKMGQIERKVEYALAELYTAPPTIDFLLPDANGTALRQRVPLPRGQQRQ